MTTSQKVDNGLLAPYSARVTPNTAGEEIQHVRQDYSSTANGGAISITIGNSATLLAANANRLTASLYNNSAFTVYIKFGGAPSSGDFKFALRASSYWEMPQPAYIGEIWGYSPGGAAQIMAYEETGDY